ncbi:hypothetical protein Csa_002707 [Cucumis sativus]|uniref:Uncharacterized protein n=1 Tax=Cucumis sativus TaxID=3659 RepID=A0A0A0LDH8_CUCSA|nr:hypothetical protein Csa_002707 [Cucumis sativus]
MESQVIPLSDVLHLLLELFCFLLAFLLENQLTPPASLSSTCTACLIIQDRSHNSRPFESLPAVLLLMFYASFAALDGLKALFFLPTLEFSADHLPPSGWAA